MRSGDEVLFYWGDEAVAAQLNSDLSSTLGTRDVSTKQSGDHTETKGARFEGTISLSLLWDSNATLSPIDLWDDHKAKEEKECKLSREVVGDYEFVATGRIDNWSGGFPDHENVEVEIEVTLTGPYDWEEITDGV